MKTKLVNKKVMWVEHLVYVSEVTGAPVPGRKVVVMGDTCDSYGMEHFCEGADLLLHEATMENALREKAVTYGHTTPEMAARSRH